MHRAKLAVPDVFQCYGEASRQERGASMSMEQRCVMTAIGGPPDCCSRRPPILLLLEPILIQFSLRASPVGSAGRMGCPEAATLAVSRASGSPHTPDSLDLFQRFPESRHPLTWIKISPSTCTSLASQIDPKINPRLEATCCVSGRNHRIQVLFPARRALADSVRWTNDVPSVTISR